MAQHEAISRTIEVPDDVVGDFASSHVHVEFQITHFLDEKPDHIKKAVQDLMIAIPDDLVHDRLQDPEFGFLNADFPPERQQEEARRDILCKAIHHHINQARIRLLRKASSETRPPPYDHPSLIDLAITDDGLIDPEPLMSNGRVLERKGFVFELCPTLPAMNSSYWLMQNLRMEHQGVSKRIRLDPLGIQPRDRYRAVDYKMWLYGVPLQWDQIFSLREELHGRWMPDALMGPGVAFTDVVWTPRLGEVHFVCEEVPSPGAVNHRGARYFHAVLVPSESRFTHLDGALRYYTEDELQSRLISHVRKVGKMGHRVKIFRADGPIASETWGGMAASFFVWNEDVARYVRGERDFPDA